MQINPPELPPMRPVSEASPNAKASPPAAPSAPPRAEFQGTQRMKQILTALTRGGLVLLLAVLIGQMVLRPGLRPTDLLASMEAQTNLGIFNQMMGAAPGDLTMTEDQYRSKIAEAERSGQAKAEIVFQRQMAGVQADKERIVGAYQTLYQRTNIIAQAGVQMEQVAQQFRQQLIQQTNGGRAFVISVYDGLCAIGDEGSCEKARLARADMIEESTQLTEGDLAKKVNALMVGIPDPATLVANADQRHNGTPTIRQ